MAKLGDIDTFGDSRVRGDQHIDGESYATRHHNAVYQDVAELYERSRTNEIIVHGDIISLDINSKTIGFTKSNKYNRKYVIGVMSDDYGFLLGGKRPPIGGVDAEEFNKKTHIPVGLTGRVRPLCKGKINKGDLLVPDHTMSGIARKATLFERFFRRDLIIGMALEDKTTEFDMTQRIWMNIK